MNIIVSLLVIAGMLFGGGATVSAAQNDLPNEPLYQVKLMSEEAGLWLTHDPTQQIDRLMQQAQTRMQEMQALASKGMTPPDDLVSRAQERIQRALRIAGQLEGEVQVAALQQIQLQLQRQAQQMEQTQSTDCADCDHLLQQTREMLRLQLQNVNNRLEVPNGAQNQNQVRTTQTPQPTHLTIPTNGTCTPAPDGTGQQNGSNSPVGTPAQQNNPNNQNNQNGGANTGSGGGQGGKP